MNSVKFIACLFSAILFLTGCWDKVEINDRAYVISLGLDDVGEKIQATYTIPNLPVLTGIGGGGEDTKFIKVTQANTLFEANKEFGKRSNSKINFDHAKVVIFGKEFLLDPNNLKKALDHFDRNPEYSKTLLMLSTKKTAKEFLEAVPNGEETTGLYLSQVFINNSEDTIRANVIELGDLIIKLLETDGNGILPNILFEDGEVILDGLAVLKDYKLEGFISNEDVVSYSWTHGKGRDTVVMVEIEGVKIPYEISSLKTKMAFELAQNGILHIDITLETEGDLTEFILEDENKMFDSNYVKYIEYEIANKMESQIRKFVKETQEEYGVDIIGAFNNLKLNEKKIWEQTKDNWEDYFKTAEVTVNSKVNVRRIGLVK